VATAYVEWGSGGDCDWGATPLDAHNYSCNKSSNGLHDFVSDLYGKIYCLECASWEGGLWG